MSTSKRRVLAVAITLFGILVIFALHRVEAQLTEENFVPLATQGFLEAADGGGLSPGGRAGGAAEPGGGQWVDGAGHPGKRSGLYRCRDSPGVSGATHHRGTGLSLDQDSRGRQPGVAGKARTHRGVGDAHRHRLAGLQ
jgi:hypothetical protein